MAMTEQQREERVKHLGASDMASILGFNDWTKPWDVFWSKMPAEEWPEEYAKKQERKEESKAIKYGNYLEPVVTVMAAEYLNATLTMDTRHHHSNGIMVAHLDAETEAYTYRKKVIEEKTVVEIKTTGFAGVPMENWGRALTQDIPVRTMIQVQAQLACSGYKWAWVALLSGHDAKGLRMYRIKPDPKLFKRMDDASRAFWNRYVIPKKPPPQELPYV